MSDDSAEHIEIRRARSDDSERLHELNETAMTTTPEYVPEAPDEDLDAIEQEYLADEESELLVGTTDGRIIAMGGYTSPSEWKERYIALDEETSELTRMRVDPECHGRGVGSAIYHELEQRARTGGYQRFILDTGVENDTARGFYEGLGFECLREVTVSFGEIVIELALYEKSISNSA